ncbi:[FeFe] hydrogenase H-cluster maturation GTPase HydF [Ruminococcus sp. Marseille-P6503]|uniref:[FeFe] hydrogenase H-cluster maturation GTPase HydF n=1 Tax=Ruminococcus sp. Marseille-P6503 TaxID=2364796 RepID=UPI000F53C30E|nr:[FeFe] hydrogenase H-cluster maturation GTPase HydF [Ruminococcus sp. Marseille-P6503]
MSLNTTPSADRVHIGIFGRRNAGKSSVINAVTGQKLSIVSDVPGTTTDPVSKTMELLPLGPVVIIDTPGLDDEGELGKLRVQKALQAVNKTDIAVVVIDGSQGRTQADETIIKRIRDKGIPYIVVYNKSDLRVPDMLCEDEIAVSAVTGANIYELKERIAKLVPRKTHEFPVIADKVEKGDFVVLVVPIDSAAPKGRLILPQQQVIRELLECGCTSVVCREHELSGVLRDLGKKPRYVVTDSQAFAKVSEDTPKDICLTSFSILFSRHKGNLEVQAKGAVKIDGLKDGDTVLISEGCTHHRQCEDIGTVKLPGWIRKHTGKNISFEFTSGTEFPLELSKYSLIIHCGGCMLNEREMKYRIKCACDAGVPITNYGTAIAHMNGILKRSLEIFPEISNKVFD